MDSFNFRINSVQMPCQNCKDRKPVCHDTCEKYLSAKKKSDEINKIKNEESLKRVSYIGSDKKGLCKLYTR